MIGAQAPRTFMKAHSGSSSMSRQDEPPLSVGFLSSSSVFAVAGSSSHSVVSLGR